jgi:hypothetical protein
MDEGIKGAVKAMTAPPLNKAILEPKNTKQKHKRLKKPLSGGK